MDDEYEFDIEEGEYIADVSDDEYSYEEQDEDEDIEEDEMPETDEFLTSEEIKSKKRKERGEVPIKERKTPPYLTEYEIARIIGERAKDIDNGSDVYINPEDITDSLKIAVLEFKAKKIPMMIRRPLPDGRYEVWRLSEFKNYGFFGIDDTEDENDPLFEEPKKPTKPKTTKPKTTKPKTKKT